jgi:DNA-binding MarR family transcriptional regulator
MQVNADQREQLLHDLRAIRRAMWRDMLSGISEHLDTQDLSFIQFATLIFLEAEGETSVTDMATALGRSLATTSRLVDGLVQRGLVHRQEDATDRRVRRVRLSGGGQILITALEQARVDAQLAAMQLLAPEDRAAVARAMTLLAQAVSRRFDHGQRTTDSSDDAQPVTADAGAERRDR